MIRCSIPTLNLRSLTPPHSPLLFGCDARWTRYLLLLKFAVTEFTAACVNFGTHSNADGTCRRGGTELVATAVDLNKMSAHCRGDFSVEIYGF